MSIIDRAMVPQGVPVNPLRQVGELGCTTWVVHLWCVHAIWMGVGSCGCECGCRHVGMMMMMTCSSSSCLLSTEWQGHKGSCWSFEVSRWVRELTHVCAIWMGIGDGGVSVDVDTFYHNDDDMLIVIVSVVNRVMGPWGVPVSPPKWVGELRRWVYSCVCPLVHVCPLSTPLFIPQSVIHHCIPLFISMYWNSEDKYKNKWVDMYKLGHI